MSNGPWKREEDKDAKAGTGRGVGRWTQPASLRATGRPGELATQGNGAAFPDGVLAEAGPLLAQAGPWAWAQERTRRLVNVSAAAALLALALPVMAGVALLIKATSPGPVLFAQDRVGLDRRNGGPPTDASGRRRTDYGGRVFRLYKFRTMEHRAPPGRSDHAQVWAAPDDPRVTSVGGFLRRTRLDELPQLWNVLRGDMNLVGPRPEQPEIARELCRKVERYPARHRVRPGITGWAQVNHPYDQCLEDVRRKVDLDLEYMHRRSAAVDLRIMAKTVPVMLFQKGAW